jgi:ADP-heptose:LPS heptosyltransferase
MKPVAERLHRFERGAKVGLLGLARTIFRARRFDPIQPDAVGRILVIRQHNQLGDMLCVTPLLRALRARYPQAFIALLTSPVNHAVMTHHPAIDTTIQFDKREFLHHGRLHPLRLMGFIRFLRRQRFDLALVPVTVSMSATSDLLAYASGARWRIGAARLEGRENPSAFFYTVGVDLAWQGKGPVHQTTRNMDIARVTNIPSIDGGLNMSLTGEERARAAQKWFQGRSRKVVAFHVGAGKAPNRWPSEGFAQVIETVHRTLGMDIFLISGPMDRDPVQAVQNKLTVPVQLIENESIRSVASCLAEVALLVTNDTGVMHVGAAVGVPVLSLFGPTDPEQWAPLGPMHRYMKSGSGNIADIRVDSVLKNIEAMLGSTGARSGRSQK